ncbi:hypothetical protein DFJ63DRAFT_315118 [Scheffersomyces coipomensis]|uniref:uncharacterized protein n=1 Tax=Scheffersomyces coipomensis TaxID=1788519 RepID=UPI00315DE40A
MRLYQLILSLISYLVIVSALADQDDDPETSSGPAPPTTVWITITTDGHPVTIQSLYSQVFMATYTSAITTGVQSGDAGLGSIVGSVGEIRTYDQTTISNAGGHVYQTAIYSGLLGSVVLLLAGLF